MNDLEVQYNVSGILCNLAMESESLWSGIYPSKDYLLSLLVSKIVHKVAMSEIELRGDIP